VEQNAAPSSSTVNHVISVVAKIYDTYDAATEVLSSRCYA
jgi:hypothetical protein